MAMTRSRSPRGRGHERPPPWHESRGPPTGKGTGGGRLGPRNDDSGMMPPPMVPQHGPRHDSALPLADFMLRHGHLDERAVDMLKKAPLTMAQEVLLCIGPEVRNASALVTKRLAEVMGNLGPPPAEWSSPQLSGPVRGGSSKGSGRGGLRPRGEMDFGGHRDSGSEDIIKVCLPNQAAHITLHWVSKDHAIDELLSHGVLDDLSADFLRKTSEEQTKDIISSLGPEIQNPSAFVTRRVKALGMSGAQAWFQDAPAHEVYHVYHEGKVRPLRWISKQQALATLVQWGVLDQSSADFLSKAPDDEAKEIVSMIGPDVRNPSAFVTRRMKDLLASGSLEPPAPAAAGRRGPGGGAGFGFGGDPAPLRPSYPPRSSSYEPAASVDEVEIFANGQYMTIAWTSQEDVLACLVERGVLDQRSAEFVGMLHEEAVYDIVSKIKEDIKNPSAFVTREAKKLLHNPQAA